MLWVVAQWRCIRRRLTQETKQLLWSPISLLQLSIISIFDFENAAMVLRLYSGTRSWWQVFILILRDEIQHGTIIQLYLILLFPKFRSSHTIEHGKRWAIVSEGISAQSKVVLILTGGDWNPYPPRYRSRALFIRLPCPTPDTCVHACAWMVLSVSLSGCLASRVDLFLFSLLNVWNYQSFYVVFLQLLVHKALALLFWLNEDDGALDDLTPK